MSSRAIGFLRAMRDTLTYRNDLTDPDPADGLHVTDHWWGARTVHHPDIPAYLEERRRRILRDGLDPIDLKLMDAGTLTLLRHTAVRMDRDPIDRKRIDPKTRLLLHDTAVPPRPSTRRARHTPIAVAES